MVPPRRDHEQEVAYPGSMLGLPHPFPDTGFLVHQGLFQAAVAA